MPATQFQQIMGKPNRSQTVGDYVFWYYECSDGTIRLEADASVLQSGTIQAQVSDD